MWPREFNVVVENHGQELRLHVTGSGERRWVCVQVIRWERLQMKHFCVPCLRLGILPLGHVCRRVPVYKTH